jgi:hypothetical protein
LNRRQPDQKFVIDAGFPEAKAAPKPGEQYERLEDFKHDLEGSEGWGH